MTERIDKSYDFLMALIGSLVPDRWYQDLQIVFHSVVFDLEKRYGNSYPELFEGMEFDQRHHPPHSSRIEHFFHSLSQARLLEWLVEPDAPYRVHSKNPYIEEKTEMFSAVYGEDFTDMCSYLKTRVRSRN